ADQAQRARTRDDRSDTVLEMLPFHCGSLLRARTGRGGLLEHLLQVVTAGFEAGLDARHRRDVRSAGGRAEAHGLEHLRDLALSECIGGLDLLAQRLGAIARAGEAGVPAEHAVGA